jgi:hypothetical protein
MGSRESIPKSVRFEVFKRDCFNERLRLTAVLQPWSAAGRACMTAFLEETQPVTRAGTPVPSDSDSGDPPRNGFLVLQITLAEPSLERASRRADDAVDARYRIRPTRRGDAPSSSWAQSLGPPGNQ